MEILQETNQDSTQNFDKISFLSDQIGSHLPFLASFLETQIFSNFIDEIQNSTKVYESAFELRLRKMKERFGDSLVRTPCYEKCDEAIMEASEKRLLSRFRHVELTISPPKHNKNKSSGNSNDGIFPLLDPSKFSKSSGSTRSSSAVFFRGLDRQNSAVTSTDSSNVPKLLNSTPAAIAETNWNFVSQLLKECKQKTKRILLEKVGSEAVEWGHGPNILPDNFHTEENTLVASLCDLLERIWSHGLINRQRKSAFWHFLYKRNEGCISRRSQLGSQAYCVSFMKSKPFVLPDHSRRIQIICAGNDVSGILATMHNVSTIREIKVDTSFFPLFSSNIFHHHNKTTIACLSPLFQKEKTQSISYIIALFTIEM